MEVFIYIILFIIGTLLGSFCTLAVYRIPLKQDITHERSYCPKCNHKLDFFDLIPLLSYIFLRGKCRYCKEKIRPRYFILEFLSGISLVLFAVSLNINLINVDLNKIIYFIFVTIYFVTLILIAGIDKEHKKIQKSIILFGVITLLFYILYLYILKEVNIYKYGICLFMLLFFTIVSKFTNKTNYTIDNIILYIYMTLFSNAECMIFTTVSTLFAIAVNVIVKKAKKQEQGIIPIGFYLCTFNIVIIIIQNFINH